MASKSRRKKKPPREDVTAERASRNEFRSAGMSRKLIPVIDTMHNQALLTQAEWEALSYYRDQASLADRSPMRSCCDTSPRGGNGPGVAIVSAIHETSRLERLLGQFRGIARAVAVDDITLAQWCIEKHGGRERCNGDGKVIAIVPVREKANIAQARKELREAAHRIIR